MVRERKAYGRKWNWNFCFQVESYSKRIQTRVLQVLVSRSIAWKYFHSILSWTKRYFISLIAIPFIWIASNTFAVSATTIGIDGGWQFDVKIEAPFVGLLCRYQGTITDILVQEEKGFWRPMFRLWHWVSLFQALPAVFLSNVSCGDRSWTKHVNGGVQGAPMFCYCAMHMLYLGKGSGKTFVNRYL